MRVGAIIWGTLISLITVVSVWMVLSFLVPPFIQPFDLASVTATLAAEDGTSTTPLTFPTRTSFLFVGDIMLDRGVGKMIASAGRDDYHFPFILASSTLHSVDAAIGNVEGPISTGGSNHGSIYSFRMNPATAPVLWDENFKAVSVANNHAGDWGVPAFQDTLSYLHAAGLGTFGGGLDYAAATDPTILTIKGIRFGFVGFTDVGPNWMKVSSSTPGVLLASDPNRLNIISAAAKKVDVLIVSYHWGIEYAGEPTARQQQLARSSIDAGATIVMGHHPHVAESLERYHGGLIMYSLGNFIFDQAFSGATMGSAAVKVTFSNKHINQITFLPTTLNDQYQVSFPSN